MSNITDYIQLLIEQKDLSINQMKDAMTLIMKGEADDAQIASILTSLRIKGETVDEVTGAAMVMRELCTPVKLKVDPVVDIVGTGGDKASLFNISTASSFVVAAAGGYVAKHGNRSVTSSSGSADLLEAAGVNLNITAEQAARCIEEIGVGFLFAVNHHPAMKYAIGPRKSLKARTIFNILGPLTNPAFAPHMLVGVYNKSLLSTYSKTLLELGVKHALVVRGDDGVDELSLAGTTRVMEIRNGYIKEVTVAPESLGLKRTKNLKALRVDSPQESLDMIQSAFTGGNDFAADIIALNAGAALYTSDITKNIKEGVQLAADAIGSGMAKAKMDELASFTQVFNQE